MRIYALAETDEADVRVSVFVQTMYRKTLYKHPRTRNHRRNNAMNGSLSNLVFARFVDEAAQCKCNMTRSAGVRRNDLV